MKAQSTILLIDDESYIIDVWVEILSRKGYNVLSVICGEDALNVYSVYRDKIDVILLDMIMPRMSGKETFDRLKKINPQGKVLLSSGYSLNEEATEIMSRGCDGFIQKPFNNLELYDKLDEILSGN
ncbi:MAG: response regulator [Desulfobacterales bacterium]|nr:response regulator [Desulfobacterales bacterium]